MLVIHYTEVSTLLIQEVALAPTNWIGIVNIPLGGPCALGRGSTQGSGERRIMFCQHMHWAQSICVMEPHSRNNAHPTPLHPPTLLLCPGNKYSQGSCWGRSGEKVPCTVLCAWYLCVLYFWPMFVCMCQRVLASVLHQRAHANSALWWPCEYSSIYYNALTAILWQRSPVCNLGTDLSFFLLSSLLPY